jgi:hypothetical protein
MRRLASALEAMRFLRILGAFALAMLFPVMASAQAQITGTVRDTSGAVMPGVTVEAASPALIEGVRAAVTDASGQYRLVDLRPGLYSVTFQLTGFNVFKREGIELPDQFIATINAELRIGSLEETITVTGETPIVDVQSVRRQSVLPGQTLRDLPVARTYGSLLQLDATVTNTENKDVQMVPGRQFFSGAGGRPNEGRIEVDGLSVGPPTAGGGSSSYNADVGNAQEVTSTSNGGLGESAVGGPTIQIIPRSGGNTVQGTAFVASVQDWMVGNNLSQDLIDRGLGQPGDVEKLWDHNLGLGGPIVKNRLWFFTNLRDQGAHRKIPGMFANKNVGDPNKRTYEADLSRPAKSAGNWSTASLRLTNQITPRNRIGVFWDEQKPCHGGSFAPGIEACRQPKDNYVLGGSVGSSSPVASAINAPETASYSGGNYLRVQQATFSSTVSNRLLVDAGFGTYMNHWGGVEIPGNPTRDIVRVVEQCTAGCAANGGIPGLTYRSQNWGINIQKAVNWKTSASYVTGRHSFKVGYQGMFNYTNGHPFTNNHQLQYRVNNGVPNQLTQNMSNQYTTKNRVRSTAVYAQEQWTAGRFTYQGAVRFDHASSYFPEQRIAANRFLPTEMVIPRTDGVTGFNDLTVRGGVAWDLFGDGKTAVKINAGRYLQNAVADNLYSGTNPLGDIPVSVTRTWTDANNNFSPDCNLVNLGVQDLRPSGGDFCGQVSDLNFGTANLSTRNDPALLGGWRVRPGDWQFAASIQQEVLPRVSVEVGYNRRWLVNFSVEDNLAVTPADFGTFSVTVPDDPRLPNAGQTISGLYNVNPNKFGQEDNFATLAKNYGGQTQMYNGLLLNASARPTNAIRLQLGVNLGNTRFDTCELRAALPEINPLNPYCDYSTGLQTRVTGLATYLVPVVDISVSSTFRSDQGEQLEASRSFTSAQIATSLGRALSGNAPNATVNLVEPGAMYGDRLNVVDMRFAKVLAFGRTRTNVGFDVYNIFNRNPVITNNFNFVPGGAWLRPRAILAARFARFSLTVDF